MVTTRPRLDGRAHVQQIKALSPYICIQCKKTPHTVYDLDIAYDSDTEEMIGLICVECSAKPVEDPKPKRARKPRKKVEEAPVEVEPEPELIEEPEAVIDETELPASDDSIITE